MRYRFATPDDVPLLTKMNRQLVEDEQHRNRFKPEAWFEERMRGFLTGDYTAVMFEEGDAVVGYVLYRNHPDHADTIYIRQVFVDRERRGQGMGTQMIRLLRNEILPADKRVTIDALITNQRAIEFYRAIGFKDYSLELEIPASA
jgi:ribosomal protein S18 acetylase RimI-like enzyme